MNHRCVIALAVAAQLGLSACSTDLQVYRGTKPALLLEEYFAGELVAWGMVQDYRNRLTRHFCVEIHGEWIQQAGEYQGIIEEDFYFDDGEQSQRIWQIVRHQQSDGSVYYTGSAADVIGEARGEAAGNVVQWQYQLLLPIKGDDGSVTEYRFGVDDWMYLIDEYRLFNRSELIKFGITLGEITLFFDKSPARGECQK